MTHRPHDKPESSELFGWLCNEALDSDAQRKLQEELESSPEAQKRYVLYTDMHVALRQYANSCDSDEFLLREAQAALDASHAFGADSCSLGHPLNETVSGAEMRIPRWEQTSVDGRRATFASLQKQSHLYPTVAIVLFVATLSTLWYWPSGFSTDVTQQELGATAPLGEELGPAQLAGAVAARWAGEQLELIEGTQFRPGQRLELVEGLAEVSFLSGARMIIQGPAIVQIGDENSASVSVGRVAATVPKEEAQFVLRTKVATISCEAAEYGVDVDVDESLLAQVYSGNVELKLSDSDAPTPRLELAGNQGLQIDAESGRLRQLDEANRLHFVRYLPKREVLINLADIVAGGNGLGDGLREGYHRGISVADATAVSAYVAPAVGDGRYHKAKGFDFIDGVFIPNGERGPVQVDSIGRMFAGFPPTTDECWGGVVMARRPALERSLPFMRLEFHGDNYGYVNWLHIASRPEELSPLGYGLIGMHSNCGITFDLHAIRARYPNKKMLRFRSLVGNLEGKQEAYAADAWVLVDGKLRYSRRAFSREDGVEEIDVPLSDRDRFLVLAVTDSGKDTAYDWVAFGDPVIETTIDTDGIATASTNSSARNDSVVATRSLMLPAEHQSTGKAGVGSVAFSNLRQLFDMLVAKIADSSLPFTEESGLHCWSESLSHRSESSLASRYPIQRQL